MGVVVVNIVGMAEVMIVGMVDVTMVGSAVGMAGTVGATTSDCPGAGGGGGSISMFISDSASPSVVAASVGASG